VWLEICHTMRRSLKDEAIAYGPPQGLPFGRWVLARLTDSGPGAPQILRLEAPVIAKTRC
jgi:hypothetical protein